MTDRYDGTCGHLDCPLPVTSPHTLCPAHRRLATITETWSAKVNPDVVEVR